jgi:hypothetical protein
MPSIKGHLSGLLPQRVRTWVWCLTDSDYRGRHLALRRRIRAHRKALRVAWPAIWEQTGGVVAGGPFAGLRYIRSWRGASFTQKVLGTYEKELWPAVETICRHGYRTVIDVGAAEGYYVCGLAKRLPQARVKAFEADESWHGATRQIAALNGLADRIALSGLCTVESLRQALSGAGECLVVCDAEGAEFHLLDPERVPELRGADVLVEVHPGTVPNPSDVLGGSFAPTHAVEVIETVPRTVDDLPAAVELKKDLALEAMDEGRGLSMCWLWLRRK